MYELTGKLEHLSFNRDGKPMVTFSFDDRYGSVAMADDLYRCEKLTIKVDKYRKKRSLDANAYLWKLCSMIAEKLSEDRVPHTKEEIYQKAIKARGIYREQGNLILVLPKPCEQRGKSWGRAGLQSKWTLSRTEKR